ncbi:MAG: ammonium transporter [Deltaproteobacteria bacterium]|nr:ammonium transporter [Deltaproteobacteria bacterium]
MLNCAELGALGAAMGESNVPDTQLNAADTAWLLTATALVLFMTIPGLSIFYGGLVRAKNVLSVLMQCLAITALVTVLWVAYGYSLAFDQLGVRVDANAPATFIGGISKLFLRGVSSHSLVGTVPESVYITFQMTFAIITPALIAGAFAERMKFSAMLWFSALWFTLVYLPICHMVWGGSSGFMARMEVFDFAGGIVVHITAGFSALVAALVVGNRHGYPHTPMPPHSLTLTVIGTGMLWVGWFGFNAGSAVAANGQAGMAMLVTQISPAVAALTWMSIEWARFGKPSVLGFATGAIAGLAAVTPGAGTVGPAGALAIGIAAGTACFFGATTLKRWGGYDDSLDAFGVHGVGGLLGTILVGIFAAERFGGQVKDLDITRQLGVQALCAAITVVWSVAVTFVLLKGIDRSIGLRADEQEERSGLDLSLHNETGYNY